MEKALVLLSGGIDSTTALYWSVRNYKSVVAVTFDYGQRHKIEIEYARLHVEKLKVEHKIIQLNLKGIAESSLLESGKPIVEDPETGIPTSYVPFRNGIFLAVAAALAESLKITHIVGGWNEVDFSGYPDCRKDFLTAMEKAINLGTVIGTTGNPFKIIAPFVGMSKTDIIRLGLNYDVDYSYTLSCYNGTEIPCLECPSCRIRKEAWCKIGMEDPLIERLRRERKLVE